jgi:hypothetical protein
VTTLGSLRIRGMVQKDGTPIEGAYLTLNSGEGNEEGDVEFIAERRTGPDGVYEFHTSPGTWTVICRAAGNEPVPLVVTSDAGEITLDFGL